MVRELVRERNPKLMIDGEIQADAAIDAELREALFPASILKESANIAYNLMMKLGGAEAIGLNLFGLEAPVNVLQSGSTVNEVVSVAAVTAVHAQEIQAARSRRPKVVGE